jgi:superfamily II DNA or RNA helicase
MDLKKNINSNINLNNTKDWVLTNKKEFPEWFNKNFLKFRATGKQEAMKKVYEPYNYQKLLRDFMQSSSPYRGILLFHGLGTGKCHGINTKILMYSGEIKNVQDIQVNEQLMGDDSTPRNVLSLASGEDNIYKISYNEDFYTVNSEHILVLKDEQNNIIEITVLDYLKKDESFKKKYKGYKKKIDFPFKKIKDHDEYVYLKMKDYEDNYIYNNYRNRLQFLLSLINLEKKVSNACFIVTVYSKQCFRKLIFLLNSCCVLYKKYNIIEFVNDIYIISINVSNNYNILEKKKVEEKNLIYVNNYEFKIEITKEKNYYGFVLDGNHRYLLGDFSVTHNTCTSITIAENLKKERNIIVMLPASLRSNFIYKGLLFCGDPSYKNNESKISQKYSFVSYNASNTLTQLKRLGSLDNKVIIIEEVHNLISKIISGINGTSKQGLEIYNMLINAHNTKIIALSGTPIINDAFEAAVLFNLLNGYNEINYYRIIKVPVGFGIKEYDNLEKELKMNKYIDYVKINKLNKSIEFLFNIKSYNENYKILLDEIDMLLNQKLEARFLELKKVSLFPIDNDGEDYKKYFVEENQKEGDNLKNQEIFKRRILGLVSHYSSNKGNYPKVIYKDTYRVEMSEYQFLIYEILRAKERLSEKGKEQESKKKANKKKKVKSTFRVFSRQSSNFVFPEEIIRPYPDPKFIVSLKKNKNDNNNIINSKFIKLMEEEERLNENENKNSIKFKDYKLRIEKAIQELDIKGNIYLRPGPNGLDKLSPKMKLILENINKTPGLVFVYSHFRTLEGVEIFSKILDHNGYSKFGSSNKGDYKYAIYSGSEDEKEKKNILETFTKDNNKYGKYIKIILATSAGAEGLDLKNIRQVHIIDPYWNQMRIQQIIGRGVRRDSHIALPADERNIEIFRYFSVFSNKNAIITKDKLSTDEHIEQLSLKKQKIIDQMLLLLKECAFDCVLNSANINNNYKCFNFGKGAKGFSYYPYISDDIIMSNTIENTKKIERKLIRGILFDKKVYLFNSVKKKFYLYNENNNKTIEINLKKVKAKPLLIDINTHLVYDINSIKTNNPIIIGKILNNKLVKV